jgi:hypothetical protein
MPVTLAWLDHDPAARERAQRILALFEERDTRDELGLGAIRDSFSDLLFPGTSTIQTRLRYMLFVPWMYAELERQRVPAQVFAERARQIELDISRRLIESGELNGVFGRLAGRKLQRLASSVYWGGLGAWGIRLFQGSQQHYHRTVDVLYRHRRELAAAMEDGSVDPAAAAIWHQGLPPTPEGFPEGVTLALTQTEAEFIRESVGFTHPESFLAHLFRHGEPTECGFPWEHPEQASASAMNRELLEHARLFSESMFGSTLLYNLLLAEQDGQRSAQAEEHGAALGRWEESIDRTEIARWDLDRMWLLLHGQGHTITNPAKAFVHRWVELVVRTPGPLRDIAAASDLIRRREARLKGARSRFESRVALERWGGSSGLVRYDYRWPTVKTFLADLHTGLGS